MLSNDFTCCKKASITDGAEETGRYFGTVRIDGRFWAIVMWDDGIAPTCHLVERILIKKEVWVPLEEKS